MKLILVNLFIILFQFSIASDLYSYKLNQANNKEIDLSAHKDSVLLIVNIATRCGYTKQLSTLEKLYKKYKSQGLVLIGVPSNEFLSQSPESNKEITKICQRDYGVTFPISKKYKVKGDQTNPLYKYLKANTGKSEISWNFEKFLISRNGTKIERFAPSVTPFDDNLIKSVEKFLQR